MKTCRVQFIPDKKEAKVTPGETLLKAAQLAGVYVNSICGGAVQCGKCRVIVKEGEVRSKPTTLLGEDEVRRGYVLACDSEVASDLRIEVPPETRLTVAPALMDEHVARFGKVSPVLKGIRAYPFDPLSRKLFLDMPAPCLDDNLSDLDRVHREISKLRATAFLYHGLDSIRRLPKLLRESAFKLTVTLGQRGKTVEAVQYEAGDVSADNCGVAVDVGTTTVVAELIELADGKVLSRKAAYNSQIHFGEDVNSRIVYASEQPGGLKRLHDAVAKDINELISVMVRESGRSLHSVTYLAAAGNTTMIHILLGLDVGNIRREPYIPAASSVPVVQAAEAGLSVNPLGLLCCLPGAGPYVGSDATADIISAGMNRSHEIALLFDLGTNGEVVLGNSEWLICCSASAGPAFEGGGLRCGMRATDGAIERVAIRPDGKISCKVIGDSPPRGICGSGLIDLAAEMLKAGCIDKSGRFLGAADGTRVKQGESGSEFVLVPAEMTATGRDISVSEEDLSVFIRSKGAIYMAAEALLTHMGLRFEDVGRVFISGGFGNFIDVGNAIVIGLLPDLPRERFSFMGNGSLNGARMCLESHEAFREAEKVASRMTYFELSTDPTFMNGFTSCLFLPHTDVEKFPSVMQMLKARNG